LLVSVAAFPHEQQAGGEASEHGIDTIDDRGDKLCSPIGLERRLTGVASALRKVGLP